VFVEGQACIGGTHATAIINDLHKLPAVGAEVHRHLRRTGIDGILGELLHNRRRRTDNLACGNLVGNTIGQNSDFHYLKKEN
jgi:hypothetical protein